MPANDAWRQAIMLRWLRGVEDACGMPPPARLRVDTLGAMRAMLHPFMGENLNHCLLPGVGGVDFKGVSCSAIEEGCLEASVFTGSRYVFRPRSATFVYSSAGVLNSFVLVELETLAPVFAAERTGARQEELFRIEGEGYISPDAFHERDEEGRAGWRKVVRWLSGNMLLVPQSGAWNRERSTYDGRHTEMSPDEVEAELMRIIEPDTWRLPPSHRTVPHVRLRRRTLRPRPGHGSPLPPGSEP